MQLEEVTRHLASKGLGHLPKPMLWVNGKQLPLKEDVGHAQALQDIQMYIMLEVGELQVRCSSFGGGCGSFLPGAANKDLAAHKCIHWGRMCCPAT